MDYILGIDGGGSKTVALLAERSGSILGRGMAGPCNLQTMAESDVRRVLKEAVEAAFAEARLPWQTVAVIGLGLAGVDRPADHARVQGWIQADRLAHKAVTGNDSTLLLRAGTPAGWGIGVISGTGSIVYGRTASGETARAGGWGYRFGDEGSGFAIGTAALRAVAKAADGRGPQTLLTPGILAHWGLSEPARLIPHIYPQNLPVAEIARLTPLVQQAAEQHDAVANAILREAAGELNEAVAAVYRRLNFQNEVPAALGGGVLLNCALVRAGLLRLTAEKGIPLQPVELVAEPARGAVRMAMESDL
jgi:N-acetylglucosamine kinase-like BadF-type ATPase